MRLFGLLRVVALALLWSAFSAITFIPIQASAQSAPGNMCLDLFADGTGLQNTCPYNVTTDWCVINPDFPRAQEGPYYFGQGDCRKEDYTGTLIKAGGSMRLDPQSLLFGDGVVWLECRWSEGSMTYASGKSGTGQLRLKPRPHFEATCMRDGKVAPGFTAMRQLSANSSPGAVEVGGPSPEASAVAGSHDLSGQWTGQSSGNQVTIEMQSGGFSVVFANQQRTGQSDGSMFFRDAGGGAYVHAFGDGSTARVQTLGENSIRVTNPDGWTDIFSRPAAAVSSSSNDVEPPAGMNLRPPSGPGPIMQEAWNKPNSTSAPPGKTVAGKGRARDKSTPHLSDDQKILNEILRLRTLGSAPVSDADARFAAQMQVYEQKLAERQKAIADYEAAQRQMAADKAAAVAKAIASQEEFARQLAAYQAEQERYAQVKAEYEARLAGQTLTPSGSNDIGANGTYAPNTAGGASAAPPPSTAGNYAYNTNPSGTGGSNLGPLSSGTAGPKAVQEGEDPHIIASDGKSAMDCVHLVTMSDKDSMMGMGGRVLSNQCGDTVEVIWCYVDGDCYPGGPYNGTSGGMQTLSLGRSWPVSVEHPIRWAACHGANTVGFVKDTAGLQYYCKAPLEN